MAWVWKNRQLIEIILVSPSYKTIPLCVFFFLWPAYAPPVTTLQLSLFVPKIPSSNLLSSHSQLISFLALKTYAPLDVFLSQFSFSPLSSFFLLSTQAIYFPKLSFLLSNHPTPLTKKTQLIPPRSPSYLASQALILPLCHPPPRKYLTCSNQNAPPNLPKTVFWIFLLTPVDFPLHSTHYYDFFNRRGDTWATKSPPPDKIKRHKKEPQNGVYNNTIECGISYSAKDKLSKVSFFLYLFFK